MHEIVAANQRFESSETTLEEARTRFEKAGEKYKLHFLSQIPPGTKVTYYRNGPFLDLCRGPHLASTGEIGAFKLTHVAGAYWLGNERNEMLQRIYGTAFPSAKEPRWLPRAHRGIAAPRPPPARQGARHLLGARGGGSGTDPVAPKGGMVRHVMEEFWKQEHLKRGYHLVFTPHIASERLFEISGHLRTMPT